MTVKYEVYNGDGDYLFGGFTNDVTYTNESDCRAILPGQWRSGHYIDFEVSTELYATFKRHEERIVNIKFISEKATGEATGNIDCLCGGRFIRLLNARYEYTINQPSTKDELLAQLDELKRKIEEAFE